MHCLLFTFTSDGIIFIVSSICEECKKIAERRANMYEGRAISAEARAASAEQRALIAENGMCYHKRTIV